MGQKFFIVIKYHYISYQPKIVIFKYISSCLRGSKLYLCYFLCGLFAELSMLKANCEMIIYFLPTSIEVPWRYWIRGVTPKKVSAKWWNGILICIWDKTRQSSIYTYLYLLKKSKLLNKIFFEKNWYFNFVKVFKGWECFMQLILFWKIDLSVS